MFAKQLLPALQQEGQGLFVTVKFPVSYSHCSCINLKGRVLRPS